MAMPSPCPGREGPDCATAVCYVWIPTVGLDTVKLKGDGFDVHVAKGDRVDAGTPLVSFDRAVIEKAGYPLITPIVVLNAKKFGSVEMAGAGEIAPGEPLITAQPAPQPAEAGL